MRNTLSGLSPADAKARCDSNWRAPEVSPIEISGSSANSPRLTDEHRDQRFGPEDLVLQGFSRHQRMHRPDREVDLTPSESTFEVDARPLDQMQPYLGRNALRDPREQPRRGARVGAEPDVTPSR